MKRAVKNAVRRALGFVLALFLLSLAVFFLSRLSPGDPLRSYYGESAERLSESERADALDRLGLDRPIIVQYGACLLYTSSSACCAGPSRGIRPRSSARESSARLRIPAL